MKFKRSKGYIKTLLKIRALILLFIIMLALSGITAFPVEMELHWMLQFRSSMSTGMQLWLTNVYDAIKDTNAYSAILAACCFECSLKNSSRMLMYIMVS